jgi:hypothetical protein
MKWQSFLSAVTLGSLIFGSFGIIFPFIGFGTGGTGTPLGNGERTGD